MPIKESPNVYKERHQQITQARLDRGEIIYFAGMIAPLQNYSLSDTAINVFDESRSKTNALFLDFLKEKYGLNNVFTSEVCCDFSGQTIRMPGVVGVYVSAAAFMMEHLSVEDFQAAH